MHSSGFHHFAIPKSAPIRTNFIDSENKLLVQIACQFEREGLRFTWDLCDPSNEDQANSATAPSSPSQPQEDIRQVDQRLPALFWNDLTSRQLIRVPGPPPPLPQESLLLAPPVRLAISLDATSCSCSVFVRAGISGDGSVTLRGSRGDASASNGNIAVFSADNTCLGASGIVGSHTGSTESGVSSLVYGGSSCPITGNMMVVSGSLTSVDTGWVDTRGNGEHRCASGGIVGMAASNSTNNDVGGGGMLDRTSRGSSGVASGTALFDDMVRRVGWWGTSFYLTATQAKLGSVAA
ncbi:unnamed protein product [Phytophthora fragariaefolia]|uniref:Unnamed protein product n=1 Tax=Phytophthora fragariaefolia TaxID=1490495 RepID=A0A9W6TN37_9STRA|nr:unnamed protein product [Phytophthora fragariaefolia]